MVTRHAWLALAMIACGGRYEMEPTRPLFYCHDGVDGDGPSCVEAARDAEERYQESEAFRLYVTGCKHGYPPACARTDQLLVPVRTSCERGDASACWTWIESARDEDPARPRILERACAIDTSSCERALKEVLSRGQTGAEDAAQNRCARDHAACWVLARLPLEHRVRVAMLRAGCSRGPGNDQAQSCNDLAKALIFSGDPTDRSDAEAASQFACRASPAYTDACSYVEERARQVAARRALALDCKSNKPDACAALGRAITSP